MIYFLPSPQKLCPKMSRSGETNSDDWLFARVIVGAPDLGVVFIRIYACEYCCVHTPIHPSTSRHLGGRSFGWASYTRWHRLLGGFYLFAMLLLRPCAVSVVYVGKQIEAVTRGFSCRGSMASRIVINTHSLPH